MAEIFISENREQLHQSLIQQIDTILAEKPAINICLSGGTTPKQFFDYWAKAKIDARYWQRIRLFWGDERCVPPDDEMSNFGMTQKHLIGKVPIPAGNIFRIVGENDPEGEARRYGALMDKEASPFDLMLLGLGDDGHTVSIFPSSISLWDDARHCVVNHHPESGLPRITITGQVVNASRQVVFLVTGSNKAQKVRDIVQYQEVSRQRYPAAKVAPASGHLLWLLDKEAASLL